MIYNEDCISGMPKHFEDKSVSLIVSDPPFGISETGFHKHYNRNEDKIIGGYTEAPQDYYNFTKDWMAQCQRILKDNGSMYVFSGWNNLYDVLKVANDLDLTTINHIIWHYNFGVYTRKKFVSSHYHILYFKKHPKAKPTFNTNCRFEDTRIENKSPLYKDLQDVWTINKEFRPKMARNKNKLPEKLVAKMIQYSSNKDDIVFDPFLGNGTTAVVAKKLERIPAGFEINKEAFQLFV